MGNRMVIRTCRIVKCTPIHVCAISRIAARIWRGRLQWRTISASLTVYNMNANCCHFVYKRLSVVSLLHTRSYVRTAFSCIVYSNIVYAILSIRRLSRSHSLNQRSFLIRAYIYFVIQLLSVRLSSKRDRREEKKNIHFRCWTFNFCAQVPVALSTDHTVYEYHLVEHHSNN